MQNELATGIMVKVHCLVHMLFIIFKCMQKLSADYVCTYGYNETFLHKEWLKSKFIQY